MLLGALLGVCVRPRLCSLMKNTRSLRPTIKIGKDRFQLSVDVHQFKKDEIRVQAHPECVVIEGKQEKNLQQGYVLRQFIRKFKLPEGCTPSKIESKLSSDGILTVTAPRTFCDTSVPTEAVNVPITYGPEEKTKTDGTEDSNVYMSPCGDVTKGKPSSGEEK